MTAFAQNPLHAPAPAGQDESLPRVANLLHVLDQLPDGVCVIDRDWRFTFVNRRAHELTGSDDVLGHNIWERFPGNLEEPFHSAYRGAMHERTASVFEAFHATLQLWVRVEAKPHEPDGIIVFFNDVTVQKLADARAAEAASQLTQAMEAVSDGIMSVNREWTITFANPNALRICGAAGVGMVGARLWRQFPAMDVSGVYWDNFHRSMEQRVPANFDAYYPAPIDGWFTLQVRPSPEGIVVFFSDITERRRRDQIMAAQQELLARVQHAARVATWELNTRTGELLYGPGSYDLSGGAGLTDFDTLLHALLPGHAERLRGEIAQVLDGAGRLVVTEFALRNTRGETVWVEARGQAVEGSTVRLRGMSIDITQRKLNEAALTASAERYRVLADLNPQALWAGDAEGNIVYANQGFLAYLGLATEDLSGTGWLQGFAPADRERVVKAWTHSVTTGADYDLEVMLREAATGQHRYWVLRARPVREAAGNIVQWLGIGTDIHEAKTYAASLRAEQAETERRGAEIESIYATSPVGLAIFDAQEFRFLNVNDLEAEIIGLPREQIVGRRLEDVVPPEGVPRLMELIRHVAAGHSVRDYLLEGELAARPGEKRFWNVNYSPVYDDVGKVRAISTATIEVTSQKRAEAALIQSEKLAAVGRLASSISHEINNPLEAITNLLYIVAHDPVLPQELKVYVHMAQSELSRVSQIATQTLRFHRQAVNPTHVTPAELMGAVVRLYTGRLANSNILVDARYATETRILCFENDIRQVLNNLIANAIDAMRHGGRLVIRAHPSSLHANGARTQGVRLIVADTGHGMTPATLARIFEPFYTTKDLNGTGLGLWISSGIVERHQGRLQVRSAVGRGTVFSLFLPCEEVTTL